METFISQRKRFSMLNVCLRSQK